MRMYKVVTKLDKLIDFSTRNIVMCMDLLLADKTTGKHIVWATTTYEPNGSAYAFGNQITTDLLLTADGPVVQPRVCKAREEQANRTRRHAEVFTPSWICNRMNNDCDEVWFGHRDIFNREVNTTWETILEPVIFPENDKDRTWKTYVDSRRLEITCGEAPFVVSRYDAATGDIIPTRDRIGILDRKLRVINENAADDAEWLKWVFRALQSVYGYEFQGDNLLIARINLLMTFIDAVRERLGRDPDRIELRKAANIIAWNFWQMDGLSGTVVCGAPEDYITQTEIDFNDVDDMEPEDDGTETDMFGVPVQPTVATKAQKEQDTRIHCRVFDWRSDRSIEYLDIKRGVSENEI